MRPEGKQRAVDPNQRLAEWGLTGGMLQDALRPGLEHAMRVRSTSLASSPGTYMFHEGMEALGAMLQSAGWRVIKVGGQDRIVHPEGKIAIVVSSATNLSSELPRLAPVTRPKGPATRNSLDGRRMPEPLFGDIDDSPNEAPLWFLLHERTPTGAYVELSRPLRTSVRGAVNEWSERIRLGFMDLIGDLSIFEVPESNDFEFTVEPKAL